jgi:Tat protein translocase TatB subunit
MPQVGPAEILVILLVGLIVFGPKRLPEIGRQVGRAMREVRKFQDTIKGELDQVLHLHEDEPTAAPSYSDSESAIAAAQAPPALPPADDTAPTDREPAPRAQSRFRAPNGSAPTNGSGAANGSTPTHGSGAANGSAPVPPRPATAPQAVAPSGARPPSRFRAPGSRPTT